MDKLHIYAAQYIFKHASSENIFNYFTHACTHACVCTHTHAHTYNYVLLTRVILKGLTLRKFVSDVCVCMFYICEVIGFVD